MTNPTIMGNATGSTTPNPAYYGFQWPELQAVLDRGQALWDKKNEIGRERQSLGEEKKRLEADLVKDEAGGALASVGLSDAEIGNAGFTVDVPKVQKRLRAIEKRTDELGAQRAGLDLAIQRHKGDLEKTLMVAHQDGRFVSEIEAANAGDLAEAQDLEAQLQAIRAHSESRAAGGASRHACGGVRGMREYDAKAAMLERAEREEQEELNRERGQHILDLWAAKRDNASDPLIETLRRAHRAKAEADER